MPSLPSDPPDLRAGWIGAWDFAHRGLHGPDVPENSRAAFRAAIAMGLGIECDVQATRDGAALVFHDWTLERLTAETGPLLSRDAAEACGIRLNGSSETIPALGEVLALIAGQVPLLVEVKSRRDLAVGPLCRSVRDALAGYAGLCGVMSFDPRVGRWFARNAPEVVRGLVVTEEGARTWRGDIERWLALRHARPDFLAYDVRDLPSSFAAAQQRRGMPVATWTVRTAEHLARARGHADAAIAEGAVVNMLRGHPA